MIYEIIVDRTFQIKKEIQIDDRKRRLIDCRKQETVKETGNQNSEVQEMTTGKDWGPETKNGGGGEEKSIAK